MEEEADALMAGRAEAAAERGEADDGDDQAVAGAAVSAALGALASGAALPGAPRPPGRWPLAQVAGLQILRTLRLRWARWRAAPRCRARPARLGAPRARGEAR